MKNTMTMKQLKLMLGYGEKEMKINDIAKEIAKREGKKSQARIGDIREILGILADMIYEFNTGQVMIPMLDLGEKRAKKRNAKKRVKK